MPSQRTLRIVAVVMILALVLSIGASAFAQEPQPPVSGMPAPDIIPEPNSGHAPSEAGDRGGALQLALLGGIVVAIGGITWHISIQARRNRRGRADEAPGPPGRGPREPVG